jgi:hypothetical protein
MLTSTRWFMLGAGVIAVGLSMAVSFFFLEKGEPRLYPGQVIRVALTVGLAILAGLGRRWAASVFVVLCLFWGAAIGGPATIAAARGVSGTFRWIAVGTGYIVAASMALVALRRRADPLWARRVD